tara:strand:+ start:43260 stop:44531 length:1272 start_codon:yes stop_codon:yes gene_type:complete
MEVAYRFSPLPDWLKAEETQLVFNKLSSGGAEVRFVGGCVRDTFTKHEIIDIDIATTEEPNQVISRMEGQSLRLIETGIDHGTVTAILNDRRYEITTLRKDIKTYGRRAKVEFTTDWLEDARRRDFTINALSCSIEGFVYDPFGGIEDLNNGRVRFVGDPGERIDEDGLRLLRFFRFFAWYGNGCPEKEELLVCQKKINALGNLSGERIQGELFKLLSANNPLDSIEAMLEAGVLKKIFGIVPNSQSFSEILKLESYYNNFLSPDPIRRMSSLLAKDKDRAIKISNNLKFSRIDSKKLLELSLPANNLKPEANKEKIRLSIFSLGKNLAIDHICLNWSISGGLSIPSSGDWESLLEYAYKWKEPIFPVSGDDVLMLGVKSGKDVGEALEIMKEWWANEDFSYSREELLKKFLSFQLDSGKQNQ